MTGFVFQSIINHCRAPRVSYVTKNMQPNNRSSFEENVGGIIKARQGTAWHGMGWHGTGIACHVGFGLL